jgi:hypothetical protein
LRSSAVPYQWRIREHPPLVSAHVSSLPAPFCPLLWQAHAAADVARAPQVAQKQQVEGGSKCKERARRLTHAHARVLPLAYARNASLRVRHQYHLQRKEYSPATR